jgi:hypothetical protein
LRVFRSVVGVWWACLENALSACGSASERRSRPPDLCCGVARNRTGHRTLFRLARRGVTLTAEEA